MILCGTKMCLDVKKTGIRLMMVEEWNFELHVFLTLRLVCFVVGYHGPKEKKRKFSCVCRLKNLLELHMV